MFISRREITVVQVYLRSILQFVKSDDFGELAYLVSMIQEDENLHAAARKLLFSVIDFFVKYNNHED